MVDGTKGFEASGCRGRWDQGVQGDESEMTSPIISHTIHLAGWLEILLCIRPSSQFAYQQQAVHSFNTMSHSRALESLYSSQHIASSTSTTHHPVLELAILSTNTSVAPQAVSSSIALAILSFGTIELTAAHSGSSSAWIVGARFPGVIFVAFSRRRRGILYMQSTYFCAAVGEGH